MNRTKIVATIGPVSDNEETLASIIKAGANVLRFNMKHGTPEWHRDRIRRAQKVADESGLPIGILIDLQGPEIRIETPEEKPLMVEKDEVLYMGLEHKGDKSIRVRNENILKQLDAGTEILIDDGFVEFDVVEKAKDGVMIKARDNYAIGHRKGMNIPSLELDLASLIDTDLANLDMAAKEHVDFVALSFVQSKKDIEILREEMSKRNMDAQVCAKIETATALKNLDEIIEETDCLMIARGDLGIEVPFEEVAYWQKTMIAKCRAAGKAVITATQMLQSMEENPRPTRAEVSDVANAVFDGSDAVMLSGESASGKYPALSVAVMRRIVNFNEDKVEVPPVEYNDDLTQTETITESAVNIVLSDPDIAAIVAFTETGTTARMLSRFRVDVPIVGVTQDDKARDELCLSYGVAPLVMDFPEGDIDITSVQPLIDKLCEMGVVAKGERIVFVHGARWQEPGLTNTLSIREV